MAHPYYDDHENDLIEAAPGGGESGALAPRTMGLFAAGFVLGAVAIGAVGIVVTPPDPPSVRPVELRSPDQSDGGGDGADRRRDRSERRRGSGRREPGRSRAPATPQARGQTNVRPTPPAATPRPRTTAPRPTPAPRPQQQPQPQPAPPAPAPAQPAPTPPPAPPADDDPDAGDADPNDGVDGSGELDNDVD